LLLSAFILLATAAAVELARLGADALDIQTQWTTLGLALALTVWAPGRFGLQWGDTTRHLPGLLMSLAAVTLVVGTFRVLGGSVPWDGWEIWTSVPLAEELLFRGACLTALVWALTQGFSPRAAANSSVMLSAVTFGLEHLGNSSVGTALVLLQVTNAVLFGLLAGWLRLTTKSLVGPVLVHSTMNLVAVV
jgi:membrane protease YdiL (CAAX protease family)